MSSELDESDKELLRDISAFNLKYSATGWHLEDRLIDQDLSNVWLMHSSLNACEIVGAKFRSAILADTQFSDTDFHQVDFANARLRNVVFTNCRFVHCRFDETDLQVCSFTNCQSERLNARNARFADCSFNTFEDRAGVFTGVLFRDSTLERCKLNGSAFHSTGLIKIWFTASMIDDVVFDGMHGSEATFEDSSLENCGFVDSRYAGLNFRRGSCIAVSFNRFTGTDIVFDNVARIEALTFRDCDLAGSTVLDCSQVCELTLNLCNLRRFHLVRCQVAYLDTKESVFLVDCGISQCVIAGLTLARARFVGTQWNGCQILGALILDEAVFDAVVLSGMSYTEISVQARDVQYLNGSPVFGI